MPEDPKSEPQLHYDDYFYQDLGKLKLALGGKAYNVGLQLSDAVNMLLAHPRPPLPITIYDQKRGIWEYTFSPEFSFTYSAKDLPTGRDGRLQRHYYLLHVLIIREY